jgi:hypothetical protein
VAFGRKLGIDSKNPGWKQRIHNWRRRGIPPAVQLEHYDTIQTMRQELREASMNDAGKQRTA